MGFEKGETGCRLPLSIFVQEPVMTLLEGVADQTRREYALPVLETERLMLRGPRRGDAEAIAALANDRRIAANTARIPHPYGVADAEPMYRLVTTILDPAEASAQELAALYHERWEIETALGELKTYVRAGRIVLRSKTKELIQQEFFGMLMLHYAIRGLMHEAALSVDEDPDRLSFLHAIRVVRRTLPLFGAFPPSADACAA